MVGPEEVWVICRARQGDLVYVRNTLEAYEGLCLATTLPGKEGRLRLLTSAERTTELENVLAALGREYELTLEGWGQGPP
jgi:hypothetical protein